MSTPPVLYERDGRIARLTLNRPERLKEAVSERDSGVPLGGARDTEGPGPWEAS